MFWTELTKLPFVKERNLVDPSFPTSQNKDFGPQKRWGQAMVDVAQKLYIIGGYDRKPSL
jgi:hypothetical protein